MTSSTSNSDLDHSHYEAPIGARLWLPSGPDEGNRRCFTDIAGMSVMIFLVAVVAIAIFREDVGYAEAPRWYWIDKVVWPSNASVVVAGDSRVYRGVDVEPLSRSVGGVARNFGFSGTLLTPTYIHRAAHLLDPAGPRVLVVGVTAASLRDATRAPDGYREADLDFQRQKLPLWAARRLDGVWLYLRPVALDLRARGSRNRAAADEYHQIFHESGWVASDRVVPDPIALGVSTVTRDFEGMVISPVAIDSLLGSIRSLVEQGVRVYAFFPPIPDPVARTEFTVSGLDLGLLESKLRAVGVLWLDVDYEGLVSYDGTHLDGPSGRHLGERLAEAIHGLK